MTGAFLGRITRCGIGGKPMSAGRNDEIVSKVGWRPTCSLHDDERWQWQALAAPLTLCEVLALLAVSCHV